MDKVDFYNQLCDNQAFQQFFVADLDKRIEYYQSINSIPDGELDKMSLMILSNKAILQVLTDIKRSVTIKQDETKRDVELS